MSETEPISLETPSPLALAEADVIWAAREFARAFPIADLSDHQETRRLDALCRMLEAALKAYDCLAPEPLL